MKHKLLIQKTATAVVAVIVIVLAMGWLTGWFRGDKITPGKIETAATAPPATQPIVVKKVNRTRMAEVVGTLQAEVRTTISSRLVANIIEMRVQAGDRVSKDQVLIALDDAAPKARVAQSQEALRSAQASLDLAELETNRLTQLSGQNVASRYELDQWRSKLGIAKADVARAQQAIVEAESVLADAQIRSPINGVVIDRQAEPGEQASPGRPLLTIYDPSRLRLEASVREALLGKLTIGQKIAIFIDSPGQQRPGSVSQIVPAADPSSRSFLVKVNLADSSSLYPGQYARMNVPLDEYEQIEIPTRAVIRVGQLDLVDMLTSGKVQRRAVRLGQVFGDQVEVLAGLREGDRIIAE